MILEINIRIVSLFFHIILLEVTIMRLSEIQNKDVINLNTGMKIGNIIDIKVNSDTGKIESLILEKKKFALLFSNQDEVEIYWNQINKIGEDVILVETLLR